MMLYIIIIIARLSKIVNILHLVIHYRAVRLGQKFMTGYLVALLLSAYGVSAQRLKLRRAGGGASGKPLS